MALNMRASNTSGPQSKSARIGIVTISDRASRGEYQDLGGPAIQAYLQDVLTSPWIPVARVIADEKPLIEEVLKSLCDVDQCCLVVTTGGTGPALRDVTPEATENVCEKLMPGFGELMRKVSLEKVPTAILSRQTAGIRRGALIVNLPGQPCAIGECLDAIFPAIPYCVELIGGPYLTTDESKIKAFRPKK
jgi:molybdopterin adenylyltransferase